MIAPGFFFARSAPTTTRYEIQAVLQNFLNAIIERAGNDTGRA